MLRMRMASFYKNAFAAILLVNLHLLVSGLPRARTHWVPQENGKNSGGGQEFFLESDQTGRAKANRMVETTTAPNPGGRAPKMINCRIYGDKTTIDNLLKTKVLKDHPPKVLQSKEMANLVEKCNSFLTDFMKEQEKYGNETTGGNPGKGGGSILDGIAIFPGTKWCGAGDIAANYDDLGPQRPLDMCCREHDLCPNNIFAGQTINGLKNTDAYTKSHCDCDWKFSDCLKAANTFTSHEVGRTYFNILQVQCFKLEYPIKRCKRYKGFALNQIRKSCQEYELDTTKPKKWQFFDSRFYAGDRGPRFNIPIISDIVNEPIKGIRDKLFNGGIIGSIFG